MPIETPPSTEISNHILWLKQVESLSFTAGLDYIDVLVDQAGITSTLQNEIYQLIPASNWLALFEGTPEAETIEYSPIVMRLHNAFSSHRLWLEQLVTNFAGTPRLTFLISPLTFDLLSRHLQALSQVKWGEQTGLLRYYDNRVFPLLFTHVLTKEQQAAFTDLALYWSWRKRDGDSAWKAGSYSPERRLADEPEITQVDDAQVGLMGCISDAEALMKEKTISEINQDIYFSRCLDIAVRASDANYFGALRDFDG